MNHSSSFITIIQLGIYDDTWGFTNEEKGNKEMIKRNNHIKQGFLEVCKTWFESHGTMRSSYTLLQFLRGAANPGLGHLIGDHDGHGLRNLGIFIFDGFFTTAVYRSRL